MLSDRGWHFWKRQQKNEPQRDPVTIAINNSAPDGDGDRVLLEAWTERCVPTMVAIPYAQCAVLSTAGTAVPSILNAIQDASNDEMDRVRDEQAAAICGVSVEEYRRMVERSLLTGISTADLVRASDHLHDTLSEADSMLRLKGYAFGTDGEVDYQIGDDGWLYVGGEPFGQITLPDGAVIYAPATHREE